MLMRDHAGELGYYVNEVKQVEIERDKIFEKAKGLGKVVTS